MSNQETEQIRNLAIERLTSCINEEIKKGNKTMVILYTEMILELSKNRGTNALYNK